MSSLTETENKNNNKQTNKQKKQNKKQIETIKKTEKHIHTHKKYSKSFTIMISRSDTALKDFTSNLKGNLLHKCNVLLQKITCWTRVSRISFRVSTLCRVGERELQQNFKKRCTVLRKNREITEKYEYSSTIPRTFVQHCLNPCFLKKSVFFTFSTRFRHFGDR